MKGKPISFSPAMVQAIQESTKTQTRRIANNPGKPPYEKSNRLWVQENYRLLKDGDKYWCEYDDGTKKLVNLSTAELTKLRKRKTPHFKRQPGRFMYKSCTRLWLEVEEVLVERLQDISDEDAIAEGIEVIEDNGMTFYRNYVKAEFQLIYPCSSFQSLWESIHGSDSWLDNPFVWVIKFKRLEAN